MSDRGTPQRTEEPVQMEPDMDAIKMFVGQIPRSWTEDDCRELFEQYGPVYQLNVLRDKNTQVSKGCCFVTFYKRADAIAAQAALHNIRVLPQMYHPVQMKPADVENRNVAERKLFVGMLNKNMTEDDVRKMFSPFGQIDECTVLKDGDGKSRGCAFVTFSHRSYALQAIGKMHSSQTMEGCTKPLVVKLADTQKEKDAKKNAAAGSSTNMVNALQQLLQTGQQPLSNPALGVQLAGLASLLQSAAQPNLLSILGNVLTGLGRLTENASSSSSFTLPNQRGLSTVPSSAEQSATALQQQQQQLAAFQQQQRILDLIAQHQQLTHPTHNTTGEPKDSIVPANNTNNLIQLTGPATNAQNMDSLQQTYAGLQQFTRSTALLESLYPLAQPSLLNSSIPAQGLSRTGGGQIQGPAGCNLFIYHLPQEFTDSDLITMFRPFGNVISVKVFVDKQTNLSRCFGFVSYDNPASAQSAIAALNGFQINSKRLKVQLKRTAEKPYSTTSSKTNGGTSPPC